MLTTGICLNSLARLKLVSSAMNGFMGTYFEINSFLDFFESS